MSVYALLCLPLSLCFGAVQNCTSVSGRKWGRSSGVGEGSNVLIFLDLLIDLLMCAIVIECCVIGWMWVKRRAQSPIADIDLDALFKEDDDE